MMPSKNVVALTAASLVFAALLSAACTNEDAGTREETAAAAPADRAAGVVVASDSAATPLVLTAADSAILASLVLTVHKSPTCGCCRSWVDHMRNSGFKVEVEDHVDVIPVKRRLGVQDELHSCHTATIGTYVLEGHVPAADVMRMLREKPEVAGWPYPGCQWVHRGWRARTRTSTTS